MKLAPMLLTGVLLAVLLPACGGGSDGKEAAAERAAAAADVRTYRANLRSTLNRASYTAGKVDGPARSLPELDRRMDRVRMACGSVVAEMDNLEPPAGLAGAHRRLREAFATLCEEASALGAAVRPGMSPARVRRYVVPQAERYEAAAEDLTGTLRAVGPRLGLDDRRRATPRRSRS